VIYRRELHRLCVITVAGTARRRSHEEIARLALEGGANVLQLRDKGLDRAHLVEVGRRLRRLTRERGALLVVDDWPDVAVEIDADGAHVGQRDLPATEARRILGAARVLGVSARTVAEAQAAAAGGADYLGVGPIHEARATKPDAEAPIGAAAIRSIRDSTDLPILAIGGITVDNVAEAFAAGADGVAVVSAVAGAEDAAGAVRALLRAIDTRF
jgi:thiamine-phosphate pyrophosphorylase